jgi:hypothetical protein
MDTNREGAENHRWTRINTDGLGWVFQGAARNMGRKNQSKAANTLANPPHHCRKHLINSCSFVVPSFVGLSFLRGSKRDGGRLC